MEKEDIHLYDIKRILFGLAPPVFLIEVFIRTLIIFALCLVVVKWLGKRMSGQMSVTEMTIMIIIGAIVSVPMQFPDRGLLQGVVLLTGMFFLYNFINLLGVKYKKAEALLQGHPLLLVKDNRLNLGEMRSASISKQQLYAQLRSKDIFNLGEVKRVYLEASGIFSVYKEEHAKAGLLLFPPEDGIQESVVETDGDKVACANCGFTKEKKDHDAVACSYCKNTTWIKAGKLKS
jgi:uncharacterized membrane protein YcaP (DUF421 family)